ncbi:unnamed protein product [Blepharisma stoltei]|uniref:Uncharacterized protein n=1 Tax=Blepharisma stoltei TaxID=1481888 RepID=A0AAU9J3U8_9CILI|nr:unnamed protein product [Blepharisma stoltei]
MELNERMLFIAFFLSWPIWSYFVYEETVPTFRGCPALDPNSHIKILKNSTFYYKNAQKSEEFIKILFDPKQIRSLLVPYIIPEEMERFKNKPDDIQVFYPSAIWLEEKNTFFAVVRVSIFNSYSFLYATFFDSEWNEVRKNETIGNITVPGIIEIEKMWKEHSSGPEDPRIFRALKGELFMTFNLLMKDKKRLMHIFDVSAGIARPLLIKEYAKKEKVIEKNWTPLIVDDQHIFFIYNYKNLQVIDCSLENKICKKVRGTYDHAPSSIKGGSPYVRFADTNYFVSFIFTNVVTEAPEISCKPYRPALSIIEFIPGDKPDFKLIYTSEPIDFQNKVFLSPVSKHKSIKEILDCNFARVLMVHSISKWDYADDIVDLTLSINDSVPLAIRVTGMTDMVRYIINMYDYGRLEEKEDCAILMSFSYHKQLWPRNLFKMNKYS